jgi:hypothetical protein
MPFPIRIFHQHLLFVLLGHTTAAANKNIVANYVILKIEVTGRSSPSHQYSDV